MRRKYHILVAPDIHLKHNILQNFLNECDYDKLICLGDYFDDFGDNELENKDTANWLKNSLTNPKHIHLFGNHDLPYFSDGNRFFCSGFSFSKNKAVNSVMKPEDWNKIKTFHLQKINKQPWLFTHAGLTATLFSKYINSIDNIRDRLNVEEKIFKNHKPPVWTARVGTMRGGGMPKGGIFWCDIREFEEIPKLNQMFGHTPTNSIGGPLEPLELSDGNWAVDTHLWYIMHIHRNGIVTPVELR